MKTAAAKVIEEETDGRLVLVEETPLGLRVYNKDHRKENVVVVTDDIDVITKKRLKGWTPMPGKRKWLLRAPEVVVCDLSEVHVNPTNDVQELYAFYNALKHTDFKELRRRMLSRPEFHNMDVIKYAGSDGCPEYRVVASDKRVRGLPRAVLDMFRRASTWPRELEEAKSVIPTNRPVGLREKRIAECNETTQHFHGEVSVKYSHIQSAVHSDVSDVVVYGYGHMIPKHDVYIFVPRAGLKYAFGFVEDTLDSDGVMLWECHIGQDLDKELKLFGKDLKGKRVAILDRSYSSGTLLYLRDEVRREGGIPYTIALFPKSKDAIRKCDGFLFVDRYFDKKPKNMKGNDTWYEDMFIDVINYPEGSGQKQLDLGFS